MHDSEIDIGIVTDEVARDLAEALDTSRSWGLTRFELREGSERRFPFFTDREARLVDEAVRDGAQVTAVSPGLLKGHVDDTDRLEHELNAVLPRAIEKAQRFDCSLLVVFGFAQYEGEPASNRRRALHAFERVAEEAAAAGLVVAIENEPGFWVDRPEAAAALLEEIDHPALRLNWDPANQHWGGRRPDHEGFRAVRPHIANLHVKDYTPHDRDVPWRPVGDGVTPWKEILGWVIEETDLAHVTLETHCTPRVECSHQSLDAVRALIGRAASSHSFTDTAPE